MSCAESASLIALICLPVVFLLGVCLGLGFPRVLPSCTQRISDDEEKLLLPHMVDL